MSVSTTDQTSMFLSKTKLEGNSTLTKMANAIVETAEPKTPKKSGNLRATVVKQVLGLEGKVVWEAEYAAAQEVGTTRGFPIVHYTTAGTGAHFAENSVKAIMANAEEYLRAGGLL